jgi:thioredoxin-like negative regulator of GroEL
MNNQKKQAVLFVSELSVYFQATLSEFQKIVKAMEAIQPYESRVIDVEKEPDLAEQYKIDAIPTLIIGKRRFIGRPKAETVIDLIRKSPKKDE